MIEPALLKMKRWELQHKYASIESELKLWQQLSQAGRALEKHNRQIRRITLRLQEMIALVKQEVDTLQQQDAEHFFNGLPRAEVYILEVHRIWNYFREKLLLRQGPPYADLLAMLDELVWQCYQPVVLLRQNRKQDPPEPPLVFLDSDRSPIALARLNSLPIDPGAASERYEDLNDVRLDRLVIPLISLPWYEATFLPEALLLAHETGHQLDYDLDLSQEIAQHMCNAVKDADRQKIWLRWAREVFADMYGVLCLGPAYVHNLMLLLARQPSAMAADQAASKQYPPNYLRLQLALGALRNLRFAAEATVLERSLSEVYGKVESYAYDECAAEIAAVVGALLDVPFAQLTIGKRPRAFKSFKGLRWTRRLQNRAEIVRDALLTHLTLQENDVRVLLVGATLAFQRAPNLGASSRSTEPAAHAIAQVGEQAEPALSEALQLQQRLIEYIVTIRATGIRGAEQSWDTPISASQLREDKEIGRRLGEQLLSRLRRHEP